MADKFIDVKDTKGKLITINPDLISEMKPQRFGQFYVSFVGGDSGQDEISDDGKLGTRIKMASGQVIKTLEKIDSIKHRIANGTANPPEIKGAQEEE